MYNLSYTHHTISLSLYSLLQLFLSSHATSPHLPFHLSLLISYLQLHVILSPLSLASCNTAGSASSSFSSPNHHHSLSSLSSSFSNLQNHLRQDYNHRFPWPPPANNTLAAPPHHHPPPISSTTALCNHRLPPFLHLLFLLREWVSWGKSEVGELSSTLLLWEEGC